MANEMERYDMAVGALALEIFRQSNGGIVQATARPLARSYLAARAIPASQESYEDAAREIAWQHMEEKTPLYTYPDPETRRQQWFRDWRTNRQSKNVFRIIQKYTATVFRKSDGYRYVVATPDGKSYFSPEGHPTLKLACHAAHSALVGLVQEVKV